MESFPWYSQICLVGCFLVLTLPFWLILADWFGPHPNYHLDVHHPANVREQAEASEDALDQLFDEDGLH